METWQRLVLVLVLFCGLVIGITVFAIDKLEDNKSKEATEVIEESILSSEFGDIDPTTGMVKATIVSSTNDGEFSIGIFKNDLNHFGDLYYLVLVETTTPGVYKELNVRKSGSVIYTIEDLSEPYIEFKDFKADHNDIYKATIYLPYGYKLIEIGGNISDENSHTS